MWLHTPGDVGTPLFEGQLELDQPSTYTPSSSRGTGSDRPTIRELPRVSIGQPETWRLQDLYAGTEIPKPIRAKLAELDFYLVRLSCSFRPLRDDVDIEWARLSVQLLPDTAGHQPIAFDLHPVEVAQEIKRNVKVTLSPTIKFQEVGASIGSLEAGFEYTELQPVISGAGAGEAEPSWDFESVAGLRLHGSKWMHLLVSAPKAMRSANANLSLSADLSHGGLRLPSFLKAGPTEPTRGLLAKLWG